MAVISITITESAAQVVAGIPKTVELSANISSSIFYTLDGATPTLSSDIYTDPIFLPYDKLSVTLKIFATNGVDSSAIISETYQTDMVSGNVRMAHAATTAIPGANLGNLYPFGTSQIQPNATFQSTANAGITVDNPALPSTSTAFDADGYPAAFTNEPYDTLNYQIVYTTTNWQNTPGYGVGTLPGEVKISTEPPPPENSTQYTSTFDPRALVIFQDVASEDPNSVPSINRQNFSLVDINKNRDGNDLYTSGLDAPAPSGSFLRSHYNPRTNCITYYYLDTWANRWIISTTPYVPNGSWEGNLAGMVLSKQNGVGFVFSWQTFQRRILF